jgi:rhomboid protease GluP
MEELVEVGRYRTLREAEQRALVLTAVGIACRIEPGPDAVGLLVLPAEAERAIFELGAYERENAPERRRPAWRPAGVRGVEAALVYAAVLLFVFAADNKGAFSVDWAGLGAAQSGLIAAGEWWRTLTALTLHSGSVHLIGNLAFGAVFGVLAAHSLGTGVAWLAIVAAGGLGNGLNAVFEPATHSSIGASTAIFGALGILSAYTQGSRAALWQSRVRRWSPVAAGIMMLAFFGIGGERTDVWAHVAGLGVGAAVGFALARVDPDVLQRPLVQGLSGAGAGALVALAWALALAR